jgi:hypothetical protein
LVASFFRGIFNKNIPTAVIIQEVMTFSCYCEALLKAQEEAVVITKEDTIMELS